jgi:methyl-accepting chemotaxis protein
MLTLFKKSKDVAQPAAPVAATSQIDGRGAVQSMARQASTLGREAAEVRGLIIDTQAVSARQAKALLVLAHQLQQITHSQDGISVQTQDSRQAVSRARVAVQSVGTEVSGIVDTLRQVSGAAGQITQIALQTRLVAFNASVEAKRAGEAGRGFGVVADAVKDLAGKVESSSQDIMRTIGELDARIEALAREIRTQHDDDQQGAFHRALADVESGVARIDEAAERSRVICNGLNEHVGAMEGEIKNTGQALDTAFARSEAFLKISESMIEMAAESGIETEDTPYIAAAQQAAAQISKLLEDALRTGAISEGDLFDDKYRPIPNTNPQQHLTRFVDLADRLFPQVQERMLGLTDKVMFCIAVDRNGYVPTHNKKHCHPQRGDLAWDTVNSRYRRIFNDRTGLASGRNTRPFLLQTYRRDMGLGKNVMLKEAAAPITVNGKHWGGLRLAFQF